MTNHAVSAPQEKNGRLASITLGALGVVYGDIGTSPLYTMKTIFSKEFGLVLDAPNLVGAVSLIFWGLILIVSLKYVTLILRADNQGEGGIMALMALALASVKDGSRRYYGLLLVGLLGAALFYGDSVITPAISVLSAIEGLGLCRVSNLRPRFPIEKRPTLRLDGPVPPAHKTGLRTTWWRRRRS